MTDLARQPSVIPMTLPSVIDMTLPSDMSMTLESVIPMMLGSVIPNESYMTSALHDKICTFQAMCGWFLIYNS